MIKSVLCFVLPMIARVVGAWLFIDCGWFVARSARV